MKFPFKIVKQAETQKCCDQVKALESEILLATNFIKNIERGNLEAELAFNVSEELDKDSLAGSLISMRDQMKLIANEEQERKWTTEGLARFVDILRSNNDNLANLADDILTNLVRYMKANQGYLFILNENEEKRKLDLAACYAYNRKKFISKSIQIGEGLVGQCFLEKEYIYMNNLPGDYVNITSGLGESLPRNLILVPLKINEEVFGVVEMASFNPIEKYQIEFLNKLGESIASTIANAKVAERTKKLLDDAQMMAEQLRSQEEEMRQNMEELSSTQEDMQRVLSEVQTKELYLNELINVPKDSIFTVDKNFKLISFNKSFSVTLEAMGIKVEKGFDFMQLFPDDAQKEKQKNIYARAFRGENFEQLDEYESNGETAYYLGNYAPLYNENREIFAVASFSKDVTEIMKAKKLADSLLATSQQQSEEMKAQEEELRQNMEELSATQEEMKRTQAEAVEASTFMNQLINASADIIYTIDRDYKIIHCNDALKNSATGKHYKIDKGFDSLLVMGNDEAKLKESKAMIQKVFNGETINLKDHYTNAVADVYIDSTYAPVRNANNEILGVAVFIKNVTELTVAKLEADKLLAEAQQQGEELKAQEEELRQNMEELSATQEELQRSAAEIEAVRKTEKERADSQIASQKKIMEQFIMKTKEKENQLLQRIKELEDSQAISM